MLSAARTRCWNGLPQRKWRAYAGCIIANGEYLFRRPGGGTECHDGSGPGGLSSLMLVSAAQLVPVADEDVLAIGRQRHAMRLGEGRVLHYRCNLPGRGIHGRNPVGAQAGHEYPAPVAGERRLEGAVG